MVLTGMWSSSPQASEDLRGARGADPSNAFSLLLRFHCIGKITFLAFHSVFSSEKWRSWAENGPVYSTLVLGDVFTCSSSIKPGKTNRLQEPSFPEAPVYTLLALPLRAHEVGGGGRLGLTIVLSYRQQRWCSREGSDVLCEPGLRPRLFPLCIPPFRRVNCSTLWENFVIGLIILPLS